MRFPFVRKSLTVTPQRRAPSTHLSFFVCWYAVILQRSNCFLTCPECNHSISVYIGSAETQTVLGEYQFIYLSPSLTPSLWCILWASCVLCIPCESSGKKKKKPSLPGLTCLLFSFWCLWSKGSEWIVLKAFSLQSPVNKAVCVWRSTVVKKRL